MVTFRSAQPKRRAWSRFLSAIALLFPLIGCGALGDAGGCVESTVSEPITPTTRVTDGWLVDEYTPLSDGRIHEPALAPDGAVWYTDQPNGCLGRLDPRTGELRVFAPKTRGANLHGLAVDSVGTVWYATGNAARLARLNPATGVHDDFALPTEVRDVHTVLVHAGRVWFTSPGSNLFGSLDVTTGVANTLPGSRPYGLAAAPDGAIWVALSGTDSVAQVSADGTRRDWPLADPASRPRRIVSDPAGRIWYNDRDRSMIGVLDPLTDEVHEYATVNTRAFPTSIAVGPEARVWYYEVRTGLLVRFDAGSGSYESIVFDMADGGVNHMVVDIDRRQLWLAVGSGIVRVSAVR